MSKFDLDAAKAVLEQNDRGAWTVPARDFYPHQWLWDSCFIAIGLRHIDPERAAVELRSLLRGQWSNGMMPQMIFTSSHRGKSNDARVWGTNRIPEAPRQPKTAGLTQPPML